MEIKKQVFLAEYDNAARQQFSQTEKRLSGIQDSFRHLMHGKTMGGIIVSLIATLVWAGAFVYGILYAVENLLLDKLFSLEIETLVMNVAAAVILLLLLFMLVDTIIAWVYYGQIAAGKQRISRLQQRVADGKNSIKNRTEMFVQARNNGWNYPLVTAKSIPQEADEIASAVSNVRSLRAGFINTMKNILFFAATVIVSSAFCIALAAHAQDIFLRWGGEDYKEAMKIVCYVVMGLVCVGEIILAKLVWSGTDCEVKPLTLLILLVPPVAFVLLTAAAPYVVMGVAAIIGLAISIAGLVFGVMCLSAFCGG